MKRFTFFILGILLTGNLAMAQSLDLGLKGGYLYSDMDVHSFKEMKSKTKGGYLLGVFARIGGDKWFFQPELQYRVRTADFDFTDAVLKKIEIDYKTLDVPLQVGIKLLHLPLVKISAHTGPVFSLKLNEKTKITDISSNLDGYVKNYKSMVWAGQVGVSVDIASFSVGLSYEKGFSDITEKGVGKNDLFMATLGIKFF